MEDTHDSWGRLLTKYTSWAGAGHKITRITYEEESPDADISRRVREFIQDDRGREYFLTETRYLITQTSMGKKEEKRQFAAGSSVCHYSLTEWYGEDDPHPVCRGKVKRTRDINGCQHFYEYSMEHADSPSATDSALWTKTDTIMAEDSLVPGQSTRTRETFDAKGRRLSLQKYVHDGSEFVLISSDKFEYNTGKAPITSSPAPSLDKTFLTLESAEPAISEMGDNRKDRRIRFTHYSVTPAGIRKQVRLDRPDGPLEQEQLINGFGQIILERQSTAHGQRRETSFAYNEKGQKVEQRTCGQAPLRLSYDALGNLSGRTLLMPDSKNKEKNYPLRLETRITRYCRDDFDPGDPAGEDESLQPIMYCKEIRAVYDAQGEPVLESKAVKISAVDMQKGESQIVYLDKYGHYSVLDTSLDPGTGELTSYSYLPGSPDSASKTYHDGRLIRQKERDGRHTHYLTKDGEYPMPVNPKPTGTENQLRDEYDQEGRLILLCKSTPEQEIRLRFSYDDISGSLLQKQIMDHYTSYEYERNGQISHITQPCGKSMLFRYTPSGNLAGISFNDGAPSIQYEYGTTGRLQHIRDASGTHDFFLSPENDLAAEEESLTETRLEYLRDMLGRPSGQILSRKEEIIQNLHLDYDRSNRIKSLREHGRSAFRFTYHPGTGHLSGIAYPQGMRKLWFPGEQTSDGRTVKYLFPHALPVLTFDTSAAAHHPGTMESYLQSILSVSVYPSRLSTTTGEWTVEYNAMPLPTVFRQEGKQIEFLYDYRGRCVEKSIYHENTLTERLRYVYSDKRLLAEFDATPQKNAEFPLLLCSYIWNPVSPGLLSMTLWKNGSGTTCYYLHDAENNIRGLVDEECRLRAAYQYGESGAISHSSGDLAEINPFRYGASYYDEDLGLYLSRFYPSGLTGINENKLPPGTPVLPTFLEHCLLPFVQQKEMDKLFSEDRKQNL